MSKEHDSVLKKLTEYFEKKHSPVLVQRVNKGYSIIHESGERIARLVPRGGDSDHFKILWWSHRDKWERIGDFGGVVMSIEEALEYVLPDPMDIFWKGQIHSLTKASMRTSGKSRLLALFGKLFGAGR